MVSDILDQELDTTSRLDWLEEKLKLVVYAEEPRDQVAANLLLFAVSVVAGFISLGATLVFSVFFAFFGTIGLLRLALHQYKENEDAARWYIGVVTLTIIVGALISLQAAFITFVGGIGLVTILLGYL